jgi:ribosomal-protein-alanine N-acetyltransferase
VIEESEIILARTQDARQIALMSKELVEFGLGWRWTPRRVVSSIRDPDQNVAIVRQGDRVIAFGIMQYGFDDAHLLLFAVQADRRREKMGSRVLRWLEETAIVAGAGAIYLETRVSNRGGRRFYQAHGYEELGLVPGYYSGQESAVRMIRRLRQGG